jgi:hypothetical protein
MFTLIRAKYDNNLIIVMYELIVYKILYRQILHTIDIQEK